MNLLWITDPHFPFLSNSQQALWDKLLMESDPGILLMGGDFANATALESWLSHMLAIYPGQIALVTGNHDFYQASISEVRAKLQKFAKKHPRMLLFEPEVRSRPIRFPGTQV